MARSSSHQCGLYTWVRANRYFSPPVGRNGQPAVDAGPPSHLLMNGVGGGKMWIPPDKHLEFLRLYIASIVDEKAILSVSENRPEGHPFPMYVDLDIERYDRDLPDDLALAYVKELHQGVRKFFAPGSVPDDLFDILVLKAPPKAKKVTNAEDGTVTDVYKTGIHVLWPNFYTTSMSALTMRETFIADLTARFGILQGVQNPWSSVVDYAVYVSSGLRLAYSHKFERCKDDSPNCEKCFGEGKYDAGRPYKLWQYLKMGQPDKDTLFVYTRNLMEAIKHMSIRSGIGKRPCGQWMIYPGAPIPAEAVNVPGAVVMDASGRQEFADDVAGLKRHSNKGDVLPRSDPRYAAVQACIQSETDPHWNRLIVDKIVALHGSRTLVVNVRGPNDRWCMNKVDDDGCHSSNRIYFIITESSIVQRCFSQKSASKTVSGHPCKVFKSRPFPLPDVFKYAFFSKDVDLANQWKQRVGIAPNDFDGAGPSEDYADVPDEPEFPTDFECQIEQLLGNLASGIESSDEEDTPAERAKRVREAASEFARRMDEIRSEHEAPKSDRDPQASGAPAKKRRRKE